MMIKALLKDVHVELSIVCDNQAIFNQVHHIVPKFIESRSVFNILWPYPMYCHVDLGKTHVRWLDKMLDGTLNLSAIDHYHSNSAYTAAVLIGSFKINGCEGQ